MQTFDKPIASRPPITGFRVVSRTLRVVVATVDENGDDRESHILDITDEGVRKLTVGIDGQSSGRLELPDAAASASAAPDLEVWIKDNGVIATPDAAAAPAAEEITP